MVYLSPMPEKNETGILNVVKRTAENLKSFEVKMSNFEIESSGYIFVGVDRKCHKQLKDIRDELINKLLQYRDSSIKKKYLDKWESFSELEKQRINKTGLPYKYKPHLTVAKVQPQEVDRAFSLIKNKGLRGSCFDAGAIQVLVFHKGINKIIGKYSLG